MSLPFLLLQPALALELEQPAVRVQVPVLPEPELKPEWLQHFPQVLRYMECRLLLPKHSFPLLN